MSIYVITGKGLKMAFNGDVYENSDEAAQEEGFRLSKIFKDVKVMKVTGTSIQIIFKVPTSQEKKQQRIEQNIARFCHPCIRRR